MTTICLPQGRISVTALQGTLAFLQRSFSIPSASKAYCSPRTMKNHSARGTAPTASMPSTMGTMGASGSSWGTVMAMAMAMATGRATANHTMTFSNGP